MTIVGAKIGVEYEVVNICTDDDELNDFLFTLGCYVGEKIVVISNVSGSYVVAIKGGRYNIDTMLAQAIEIN